MNGAIAELPPMTINNPKISKTNIIGTSQNFFLSFKNFHRSDKNSILIIYVIVIFQVCIDIISQVSVTFPTWVIITFVAKIRKL